MSENYHPRGGFLPEDRRLRYWYGVDLGQRRDYTAMAVLERRWHMATVEEFIASAGLAYHGEWIYRVTRLERVALGTPYIDIAEWIKDEIEKVDPRLPSTLVLDGTGVGTAVVDYLRHRKLKAEIVNVIVTGGAGPGHRSDGRATYAPRADIMSKLQMAVEAGRFTIDRTCKQAPRLAEELKGLQLAGKPQEGDGKDDLAFALALAVWWGLR